MTQTNNLFESLVAPFRTDEANGVKIDIALVAIFVLINGIVLVNAGLHEPKIGYDGIGHLRYLEALSELRPVTPDDSSEFFSPPLPYTIPALLIHFAGLELLTAAKVAQFLNFFLSVGLTWLLIKICHLLSPISSLKFSALVFLGLFPVYYKTFVMIRGEPYVAFFSVVMLYYALRMSIRKQFTLWNALMLGSAMGLAALSRQWGILLFPAFFLYLFVHWIRLPELRVAITKTICLCMVIIFVVSGWHYLSLYARYGSMTAFNRDPQTQWSLSNQPLEFYVGISPKSLFTNPIRPNFPNQFIPIFYSDFWGDYWGYFTFYGIDMRSPKFVNGSKTLKLSIDGRPDFVRTNYETIGNYLGRVNLLSLFPSILILVSFVAAVKGVLQRRYINSSLEHYRKTYFLLLLSIGACMAGYFWFLILYPDLGKGDTIKATYVSHLFPSIAILAGIFLEGLKKSSLFRYRLIVGGLFFVMIHNSLAMVTQYYPFRLL